MGFGMEWIEGGNLGFSPSVLTLIRYSEDPTEDTKWSLLGKWIPVVFQYEGLSNSVLYCLHDIDFHTTFHLMILVKWFLPTRLETRTKESNICASH